MSRLVCSLCDNKLSSPKLCPHCSQIFCSPCINRYLAQKHFCPSCDNYIIDLVDCGRLVSELQQVVQVKNKGIKYKISEVQNLNCFQENLANQKLGINAQRRDKNREMINNQTKIVRDKQKCELHNLDLAYFCKNCKQWICSDCGVLSQIHRQHQVMNKEQSEKASKQEIQKQINKLQHHQNKVTKKKQKTILDLQVYKAELKWAKSKTQSYYLQLMKRIDEEGQLQVQQLVEKIKQYDQQLKNLSYKKICLQHVIKNKIDASILSRVQIKSLPLLLTNHNSSKQSSWRSLVQQQQQENYFFNKVRKIKVMYNIKQIRQEIFPNFDNFAYQFDYRTLKQEDFHYSNYFELWGQDWRLKIYPQGNSGAAGKFLSVFLELANGYWSECEQPKKYIYRIELLSLNRAGSTIVKQYCSMYEPGESWGYSDYLGLQHVQQYLQDGKLMFCIGIRNQSYAGLCADLKRYTARIQNENRILQRLVCEDNQNASLYEISRLNKSRSEAIKDCSLFSSQQLQHQNYYAKIQCQEQQINKYIPDFSQRQLNISISSQLIGLGYQDDEHNNNVI